MLRIAILIWVMLGATLAGTAVAGLLASGLATNPMRAIPLAALAGFVVAIPLSYIIAAKIGRARTG